MRVCVVAALLAIAPAPAAAAADCGKMPCALAERLSGIKDREVDLEGVCDTWALQSNPWRTPSGVRSGRDGATQKALQLAITLAADVPRDLLLLQLAGMSDPYKRGPLLLRASAASADQVLQLAQRPQIASIEPDCPLPARAISRYTAQWQECPEISRWNAEAIGLKEPSRAPARTYVVIMDSGLQCRHPDLLDAMATQDGSPFPPNPDDGAPCPWAENSDFVERDHMPNACSNWFECAHGTSMASIIGGRGKLVTGINKHASLRSVRVLRGDGNVFDGTRTLADLAEAIRVANGLGAHVINVSWTVPYGARLLKQAIVEVGSPRARGPMRSLVVAASADVLEQGAAYPADFLGVANLVSVAAVRVDSDLSIRTSTMRYSNADHFVAPGYANTAMPPDTAACGMGESVATAYVSGAASRVMSDPRLTRCTPAEIKEILLCAAEVKPLVNKRGKSAHFLSLVVLARESLRSQACASGRSWPACVP
jgi:subtilisin family serine protease